MPVITATPIPTSTKTEIPEKILLMGLALTSFAALLLELSLTRLFSVVLFYHFAFLAISIALLGLGAGGVCAYLLKTKTRGQRDALSGCAAVHDEFCGRARGAGNRSACSGRAADFLGKLRAG